MAHKTKESVQNPWAVSAPSCPTRRTAPFPTKARIPSTNTRIGWQRNKSRTFNKQNELFVFTVPVFFISSILASLFSYPPSLSLFFLCYNLLLSLSTTLSAPSYPFSAHLPLPLLSFSTCHHTTPPSKTLSSLLYQMCIPPHTCNSWHKHPPLQQQK
jgi:hypothetical protein